MSRRLGSKERNRIYPYVKERDGDYCLLCAVLDNRRTPAPPGSTWELDHADSNRNNWRPENMHAVCHGHHKYLSGLSPGEHRKVIHDASIVNMRERENNHSLSSLNLSTFKHSLGYEHGPVEMRANGVMEIRWLECAFNLCKASPSGIPKRAFINDCANYARCAHTTSRNYYETHVLSPTFGEFCEELDGDRHTVIKMRAPTIEHRSNGHKGDGHGAKGELDHAIYYITKDTLIKEG